MEKQHPKPLVSVLMPAYNQGAYVAEAIESVLAQTYRPIELVIVNDGSQDGTAAILDRYAAAHPEITVIHQENTGVCTACNHALTAVRGEFLVRLDADDYLPPDYLETLYHSLKSASKRTAFAYCDAQLVGVRTGWIRGRPYNVAKLICDNYINVSGMVRTAVAREVGYYNPNMDGMYEDWDFWLTLAERGYRGIYCRGTKLYYRQKAEGGRNQIQEQRHKRMHRQLQANHVRLYYRPYNLACFLLWRTRRRLRHILCLDRPALGSAP